MWHASWTWLKGRRAERAHARPDLADMGTEIGLDASLESRLPPLFEGAASRTRDAGDGVSPLGTDHRSRFA
jgi:hypothetical protein